VTITPEFRQILSIETSCDDTSVAVVRKGGFVVAQVSANQDLQHTPYGGVVPEIASRNHSLALLPLIDTVLSKASLSWAQIDGLAVTNRPGLIGSLIVGLMTVKALSQAKNIPYVGVNHLEGHLLAPFLRDDQYSPPTDFTYPYVALAVSGGHSSIYWVQAFGEYQVIGSTKDDAAGEAFDKFAKMIGLGYPGGALVDQASQHGDATKYNFPRSLIDDDSLMLSFSGLKSAAQRLIAGLSHEELITQRAHLCSSFQEAIVDVLVAKVLKASARYGSKKIVFTGGVSANSRLRQRAQILMQQGYSVVIPPLRYCTDNAAMIGFVGIERLNRGGRDTLDLGPGSTSYPTDFQTEYLKGKNS
jgi:N6-L-threonylcarbamoyladenine synthase